MLRSPVSQMIPIYQVDAFAEWVFTGNPAAICPLEQWLPDSTLRAIASENNLSETGVFVPDGDGYQLRWFTPITEVDLCGHATLAAAHVLFTHLGYTGSRIHFTGLSGDLYVTRDTQGRIELDFPSRPAAPIANVEAFSLLDALGLGTINDTKFVVVLASTRDYFVVLNDEEAVRSLRPRFPQLARQRLSGTIVTSIASDLGIDFVSRFFAPAEAIDEDPVTGSAHCTLIPYWSDRLKRSNLEPQQISPRGGRLSCVLNGQRVKISGRAVTYLCGPIHV